jgi:hypothetical protein
MCVAVLESHEPSILIIAETEALIMESSGEHGLELELELDLEL